MPCAPSLPNEAAVNPAPVAAFIALGSNLGDPAGQIRAAFVALAQLPHSRLLQTSRLYANPPMGPQDQPDYVNAVALLSTQLRPLALLDALQAIEQAAGRFATRHWGERMLDLDILTYGDQTIHSERLTIPHLGLAERRFVLAPWADIGADVQLPDGRRVVDLLAAAPVHPLHVLAADDDPARLADAKTTRGLRA